MDSQRTSHQKERDRLWVLYRAEFFKRGPNSKKAQEYRSDFIEANRPMAWNFIQRHYGWLSLEVLEEMNQECMLAIIKAFDKFDHDKYKVFSTYAIGWIRQTADRYFQSSLKIHLPVHRQETGKYLARAEYLFLAVNGSEASSDAELADFLECDALILSETRRLCAVKRVFSLDQPFEDDGNFTWLDNIPDCSEEPFNVLYGHTSEEISSEALQEALDRLDERTRAMLLQYFNGSTLEEVGLTFGVTRQLVHQSIRNGIRRLRQIFGVPGNKVDLWAAKESVSQEEPAQVIAISGLKEIVIEKEKEHGLVKKKGQKTLTKEREADSFFRRPGNGHGKKDEEEDFSPLAGFVAQELDLATVAASLEPEEETDEIEKEGEDKMPIELTVAQYTVALTVAEGTEVGQAILVDENHLADQSKIPGAKHVLEHLVTIGVFSRDGVTHTLEENQVVVVSGDFRQEDDLLDPKINLEELRQNLTRGRQGHANGESLPLPVLSERELKIAQIVWNFAGVGQMARVPLSHLKRVTGTTLQAGMRILVERGVVLSGGTMSGKYQQGQSVVTLQGQKERLDLNKLARPCSDFDAEKSSSAQKGGSASKLVQKPPKAIAEAPAQLTEVAPQSVVVESLLLPEMARFDEIVAEVKAVKVSDDGKPQMGIEGRFVKIVPIDLEPSTHEGVLILARKLRELGIILELKTWIVE